MAVQLAEIDVEPVPFNGRYVGHNARVDGGFICGPLIISRLNPRKQAQETPYLESKKSDKQSRAVAAQAKLQLELEERRWPPDPVLGSGRGKM